MILFSPRNKSKLAVKLISFWVKVWAEGLAQMPEGAATDSSKFRVNLSHWLHLSRRVHLSHLDSFESLGLKW